MSFSILIPYCDVEKLGKCVRAIRKARQLERIIAIFDDVEGTGLLPREGTLGPNVEFHMGQQPYIGSRNGNDGMRLAGQDDVILMGDDVILMTMYGLTKLHRSATLHPHVGIMAPMVQGSTSCWQQRVVLENFALGFQGSRVVEIDAGMIPFICVCVRRDVYDKVGPFDEDFTQYGFDDNDYCIRVKAAGLWFALETACLVEHESVPSTWHPQGLTEKHLAYNREVFYRKYPELRPEMQRSGFPESVFKEGQPPFSEKENG